MGDRAVIDRNLRKDRLEVVVGTRSGHARMIPPSRVTVTGAAAESTEERQRSRPDGRRSASDQ